MVAAAGVVHREVVAASEAVSAGVAAGVRVAASEVVAVAGSGEEAAAGGTKCTRHRLRRNTARWPARLEPKLVTAACWDASTSRRQVARLLGKVIGKG